MQVTAADGRPSGRYRLISRACGIAKCCKLPIDDGLGGFQSMAQSEKSWPLFPSLAAWRAADLPGDLIAGLTLAAIAIPEQMATARLGGFAPQIGFFALIGGVAGVATFRGARR